MATAAESKPDQLVRAADPVGAEYAELAAVFDRFAPAEGSWRRRNSTYHRLIAQITRFHVPPGLRVLEIGCGGGDLLAALRPSHGVGVDVSEGMVALARASGIPACGSSAPPASGSTWTRRST